MKRAASERGTALLWAMALSLLVSFAVASVAGALSRQAQAVRRLQSTAARADLERAARAWLAESGSELRLELAGGSVEIVRAPDGALSTRIDVRGERAAQ